MGGDRYNVSHSAPCIEPLRNEQRWDLKLIKQPAEVFGTQQSLANLEQKDLVPVTDRHAIIIQQLDPLLEKRVENDGMALRIPPQGRGEG